MTEVQNGPAGAAGLRHLSIRVLNLFRASCFDIRICVFLPEGQKTLPLYYWTNLRV